jgi:Protein of unknown function (DUF3300)
MENDMVARIADRSWRSGLKSCAWLICATLIAVAVRVAPVNAQGTPQAADPPALSPQQLEQIVAPIALYPDDLLSQVLMASTYPLEVVQAARWVSQNPNTTGKPLEDAMAKQTWDPSVKGLVAVPQTLQMMSDKLDWTQQLGDAFLDDQGAVLDAVQRLRKRAEGTGNLKTSPQMKVSNVSRPGPTGQPAEYIVVEPADPQVMYVPVYDPGVVYGAWPYPDYPPYYWQPPGWIPGTFAYGALAFGASVAVGAAIWGGANWGNRSVNINANRYNSFNRTNISGGNWNHNGAHRGNVPYRNNAAAQKFGGQSGANRARGGQGGQGLGQGAGKGQGIGQGGGKQGLGQGGAGQKGAGAGQKGGGQKGAGAGQKGAGGGNKMSNKGGGQGKGAGAGNRAGGGNKAAAKGGGNRGAQGAARSGNINRGGGGGMKAGGGGHRAAMGGGGGGMRMGGGGGGMRGGGGGGGMRMGGGGGGRGGGRGGGGRRSDISVKHDVAFLGRLDNGLGLYRFSYNGSDKRYVGVMAQEVQFVRPDAVSRDAEGILRVHYDRLGVRFQTYDQWLGSGARLPVSARAH